jgi:hypothetical protein
MRANNRRPSRFAGRVGRLFRPSAVLSGVVLAVAPKPATGQAQTTMDRQECHAARDGSRLTTTVTFPDGYSAEARWTVIGYKGLSAKPQVAANVELEIDGVVEGSTAAGWREHGRFVPPFRMKLVRTTLEELTRNASASWCNIVGTLRAVSPSAPLAALARIT